MSIGAWEPPHIGPAAMGTDVLLWREGPLGRIRLNRPKAINALTLEMVRQLHVALDELAVDDAVDLVLLDGAGDRGFCAGGDIVALQRSAIDGTGEARTFWSEEYALNARVARFSKPVVAVMDGIVMGGGIGLAGHASHRLATERLAAAMPEVGIGFAPDVGGTWLLAHAPGELGTHLALTAGRAGASDAVLLGLADRIVPSSALEQLSGDLRTGEPNAAIEKAAGRATDADLAPGVLGGQRPWIDAAYAADTAEAIVAGLDARPEEAAAKAAAAIRRASPTSVKVTLRALREAASLPSLEAALEAELRISCGFLGTPDFPEGIRAQVIDKDRAPRWNPPTLEQVGDVLVEHFFAREADAFATHHTGGSTT
ncbi:MAG: enoyl-CoA hydratase/isomerase family protein [Solirubrobacteraceae bacterium]|nr:enoyl-CoA hydratase/isomerase family protein [Solirubrobacteraceae bacterium]